MKSKPSPHHIDAFVAHTIATLPDSLKLRKTVLVSLLFLLPRDYPNRPALKSLVASLAMHESSQLKLSLQNDGDGHH